MSFAQLALKVTALSVLVLGEVFAESDTGVEHGRYGQEYRDLYMRSLLQQNISILDLVSGEETRFSSPEKCSNQEELDEWFAQKQAVIKTYVPQQEHRVAMDALVEAYKKRIGELTPAKAKVSEFTAAAVKVSKLPTHAKDCTTEEELKHWRDHVEANIKNYVPKDFQDNALHGLEKDYNLNLARLKESAIAADAPQSSNASLSSAQDSSIRQASEFVAAGVNVSTLPTHAKDCNTEEELKRWRDHVEANIKNYVPKEFQDNALHGLEKDYKLNLARLKGSAIATDAPTSLNAGSSSVQDSSIQQASLEETNTGGSQNLGRREQHVEARSRGVVHIFPAVLIIPAGLVLAIKMTHSNSLNDLRAPLV